MSEPASTAFGEFLARYKFRPVLAVREWWKVEPDEWQQNALEAYANPAERYVSIRSAPGPGKTCLAAWCAIHHFLTRFPQKTIVTAPGRPQLEDSLWPEIKLWIDRLPANLKSPQLMDIRTDRINHTQSPMESFISLRTARAEAPENFQGIHSPDTLTIFDEASGIADPIYEAAIGSDSDPIFTWLLISNPVRRTGFFYQTHTSLRDRWTTFKVGYKDSPRISTELVESVRRTYGEDSNAFRIRCLGDFPTEEADTLIPFELAESARLRDIVVRKDAPIVWGLDVARFGADANALCKRQGTVVPEPVKTWTGRDLMQTVGKVKAEWDDTDHEFRPSEILVDVIGLGAGVCDRLRELGLPARGINVGETAASRDQYFNLRSELWFKARDFLDKRDSKLPEDDDLIAELTAPRFQYRSDGRQAVESKEDTKKRMPPGQKRSPDRADAFCLTLASDTASMIHGGTTKRWNEPLERKSTWVV